MKKLLFVICILLASNSYSQSTIKKYNSLQNRYEYFENGRMVGYEKYNSLKKQWEYYSTKKRQTSNSYGEPISTFDADLAYKVLAKKQAEFDYIQGLIDENLKKMGTKVANFQGRISNKKLQDEFGRIIDLRMNSYLDENENKDKLTSPSRFHEVSKDVNYIIEKAYRKAVKKIENKNKEVDYTKSNEKYIKKLKKKWDRKVEYEIGDYVSAFTYSPLKDSPNLNAKVIEQVTESVRIIGHHNGDYYKVRTKHFTGYISSKWLKEKVSK
jgi:hypothetical protein